jgi:hypothetical protein
MNNCYLVICACRNEADCMRQSLDTVNAQSIHPAKWVIVDDGSADARPVDTGRICETTRLSQRASAAPG